MNSLLSSRMRVSAVIGVVTVGGALWLISATGVLAQRGVPGKAPKVPPTAVAPKSVVPKNALPGAAVPPRPPVFVAPLQSGEGQAAVPASVVFQTADGATLSTRRVNQITCRARLGGKAWLGTHLGVKLVDSQSDAVRHYTRRDGLPGDYVEDIAADANGVYCIVRVGGDDAGRIALCALDTKTGRWKTLQEARPLMTVYGDSGRPEDRAWMRLRGSSRLAMDARTLLFAPATLGPKNDAVLYALDRATQAVRAIRWDPNIRADHPVLGISFLAMNGGRAYLGTDIGLFTIGLGAPGAEWQRYLPSQVIDGGVMTPDGKTIWLTVHNRRVADPAEADAATWRLLALETKTGQVTKVPPPAPEPVRPFPSVRYGSTPYPEEITLGPDGSVWLLRRSVPGQETFGALTDDRFYNYTPPAKTWEAWTLAGDAPDAKNLGPQNKPAREGRVPDAAALWLAYDRKTGERAVGSNPWEVESRSGSPLSFPAVWVRARFPGWFSPEDSGFSPEDSGFPAPSYGDTPDPAEPGMVWLSQGNALVHVPEADRQKEAPATARYTYGGGALTVRPRVEAVMAQGDDVVVHTSGGLYRLASDTDRWTTVFQPKTDGSFDALNNQLARGGPGGSVLFRRWGDTEPLRRLDTAADRFVDSAVLPPPNTTMIGASAQGAWFRTADRKTAYFLPLGMDGQAAGAAEKIESTLPAELAPPALDQFLTVVGTTADTAWFVGSLRRRETDRYRSTTYPQVVIGYNRALHRWTAPLELDPSRGYEVMPFSGTDGATYIARDQGDAAVYRYDVKADRWEGIADPLPTPAQLGDDRSRDRVTLLAAGEGDIALTDWKYLYRYDRTRGRWSHDALPAPLQEYSSPFTAQWRTTATKNGYWIGSEQGLWSYDLRKQTWQEKKFPLQIDPAASSVNLWVRAVDRHSVWGGVSPKSGEQDIYFRFDRATKAFTLYHASEDVPVHGYATLVSDGDGLWMIGQDGTYRLDPQTGRATLLFRRAPSGSPGEKPEKQSVPIGSVIAVREDPGDTGKAYVLLNSAGGTLYPKDDQPAILYRYDKRSGALEPLPITPTVLTTLAERNKEGSYASRPPSITGTGGLLIEPGQDLWVGTTAGVFRVDPKTGAWRLAELPPGSPQFPAYSILPAATGGVRIQGARDILQVNGHRPKAVAAQR